MYFLNGPLPSFCPSHPLHSDFLPFLDSILPSPRENLPPDPYKQPRCPEAPLLPLSNWKCICTGWSLVQLSPLGRVLILQHCVHSLWSPISQSVVYGPAAARGLLECRNTGSSPDLQNQTRQLNKIPRWFWRHIKAEETLLRNTFSWNVNESKQSMLNLPNIVKVLISNILDINVHDNYL